MTALLRLETNNGFGFGTNISESDSRRGDNRKVEGVEKVEVVVVRERVVEVTVLSEGGEHRGRHNSAGGLRLRGVHETAVLKHENRQGGYPHQTQVVTLTFTAHKSCTCSPSYERVPACAALPPQLPTSILTPSYLDLANPKDEART